MITSGETNTALGMLFNMLAFVVGGSVYFYEARRRNLNRSRTTEVALAGALIGVVLSAASQWAYAFIAHGHDNPVANGGRTILGGVIGGWIGVELWKRKLGIKESTGALWALALPAGEAVGRIGCWFHGCCYGKVCTLPWAVYQHDALRHPTQFYLSIASIVTFAILWWQKDKTDIFALSLLLWSLSRMVIEPLRESSTSTPWLVPAICAGVALYAAIRLAKSWKPALIPTP